MVPNSSPITSIRVISVQGRMEQLSRGATFLLCLNGETQTEVDGRVTFLNRGDLLLVEPCAGFRLSGRGSNLLMIVQMDYDFFSQYRTPQHNGRIVCNSVEDNRRDYSIVRQMLSYLGVTWYGSDEMKELRLRELCYSLLYLLSVSFFVKEEGESEDLTTRGRHIIAYVESNYMNEIQLEDLSKAVYLSTSYLSRLFKRLTGTNFKAYLEEVRLRHASEELRQSDKTITAIAYNNGFPNVSALSSAIRKKYDLAANEYRQMLQKEQLEVAPPSYQEVEYSAIADELQSMAGAEPVKLMGKFQYPAANEYTVEDVTQYQKIPRIWKSMINLGPASSLADRSIGPALEMVQNEIGFRYARIENVLDESAVPSAPECGYNFSRLFRTIQLLLSLHLTPYLDLSFSADALVHSRSRSLYRGDVPRGTGTEQIYLDKATELIRRCINTFGANLVEQWIVEICIPHDDDLHPTETPEEYARRFCAIHHTLKSWLPNIRIGGSNHHIAEGTLYLREIIRLLKQAEVRPDFFSVCAVPYEATQLDSSGASHILSPNPSFILSSIQSLRNALTLHYGESIPLYVSVLAPDIRIRNFSNDSCYQAVFFAKNTVDLIGLADIIGYWQLSDADSENADTNRMFFGGTGILSKDGLKKPGFAALKRMARLEPLLIRREDGMVLTTNGINAYTMLLYNYSHFNSLHCLSNGEGTEIDNVYTVFNNPATKDVAIRLGNLRPGRYRVIVTTINREHGSIFDEWLRYDLLDEPQPYDVRYLRDITHPHRAVSFYDCEDGRLDLTVQMLPHEVKFILILLVM